MLCVALSSFIDELVNVCVQYFHVVLLHSDTVTECCCERLLQYGAMELTNHMTKCKAVVNFRPCGWFGRDLHKIDGFLLDR